MGKLRYFLGIEVARSQARINFSQRKYVLDLLEETGLLGACLVDIPMDPNLKLLKDEGELFEDPGMYRCLVGKLQLQQLYNACIGIPQFFASLHGVSWLCLCGE